MFSNEINKRLEKRGNHKYGNGQKDASLVSRGSHGHGGNRGHRRVRRVTVAEMETKQATAGRKHSSASDPYCKTCFLPLSCRDIISI